MSHPAGIPTRPVDFSARPMLVFWEITRSCPARVPPLPRVGDPGALPGQLRPRRGHAPSSTRSRRSAARTRSSCSPAATACCATTSSSSSPTPPVSVSRSACPLGHADADAGGDPADGHLGREGRVALARRRLRRDPDGRAPHPGATSRVAARDQAIKGRRHQLADQHDGHERQRPRDARHREDREGLRRRHVGGLLPRPRRARRGHRRDQPGGARGRLATSLRRASHHGFVVRTVGAVLPPCRARAPRERRGADDGAVRRLSGRLVEPVRRGRPRASAHTAATRDGKGIVFVAHDGQVYPAGFLPLETGSVRERPLAEIYRDHPTLKAIRAAEFTGRCGACEFADLCGGSRARAYASSGDPLGEDTACNVPTGVARRPRGSGRRRCDQRVAVLARVSDARARRLAQPRGMDTTAEVQRSAAKRLRVADDVQSGTAVPTPVWVSSDGDRLYVWTQGDSGKVKRIRNNGHVLVAPSDSRGGLQGSGRRGEARILDSAEDLARVQSLHRAKYGLPVRAVRPRRQGLPAQPTARRGRDHAVLSLFSATAARGAPPSGSRGPTRAARRSRRPRRAADRRSRRSATGTWRAGAREDEGAHADADAAERRDPRRRAQRGRPRAARRPTRRAGACSKGHISRATAHTPTAYTAQKTMLPRR